MRLEDRGKDLWATFTADMMRYTGDKVRPWSLPFWKRLLRHAYIHPGLFAVVVYRYGQWVQYRCKVPVVRQLCNLAYYYWFNWVRTRLQIELPRDTAIDAGLRIDHFGSIIVNCQLIAGKNLTITHGVLIGQTDTGIPRFGDGVAIGVGAKVIGGITLGDNVLVGAGAVVTKSFPDNAIIAGVPARLLRFRTTESAPPDEVKIESEDAMGEEPPSSQSSAA
jgi:serine O-acetyltransferase